MAALPPFRLTKWYLDCVSDTGEAAIVYAARVEWRKLRLHYSSLLSHINGTITTHTSMTCLAPQQTSGDRLSIQAPRLHATGEWKRIDPSVGQVFLETERGFVHWNCLHPRAHARVALGDRVIEGMGYAECLTLTIPPWQLPLQRLQWGRWLSDESSIVWVDWQGSHSGRWAWRNGLPLDASQIAPDQLTFASGQELHLDRALPLREGQVSRTILPSAASLARIFPGSLFAIQENKWLSRGDLVENDRRSPGWAIHELVEWNQ